jgi:hypothetical protein
MRHKFSKRDVLMLLTGVLVAGILISPAGAHVGGTVAHLWGQHIKPRVTNLVFTKTQSDARYLGKTAKAADADRLDGLNSTAFLGAGATAANAALLDGQDSSAFAPSSAEAWHEIGAVGEPPFDQVDAEFCQWTNFDGTHNSAAFYRDPWGQVHLKGLVKMIAGFGEDDCDMTLAVDRAIFTLPEGYRPALRTVFTVMTSGAIGRVNVDPDGVVSVDTPITEEQAKDWVTLDGLDFRAASVTVASQAAEEAALDWSGRG